MWLHYEAKPWKLFLSFPGQPHAPRVFSRSWSDRRGIPAAALPRNGAVKCGFSVPTLWTRSARTKVLAHAPTGLRPGGGEGTDTAGVLKRGRNESRAALRVWRVKNLFILQG